MHCFIFWSSLIIDDGAQSSQLVEAEFYSFDDYIPTKSAIDYEDLYDKSILHKHSQEQQKDVSRYGNTLLGHVNNIPIM